MGYRPPLPASYSRCTSALSRPYPGLFALRRLILPFLKTSRNAFEPTAVPTPKSCYTHHLAIVVNSNNSYKYLD